MNLSLPRGKVLHTEKPFVYALKFELRTQLCDACFQLKNVLLKCTGCQTVFYCDKFCQKEAWPFHKYECYNFKKRYPKPIPDGTRMLARLVMKLRFGGQEERSFWSKTKYRMYKDLMSHYSEIKKDERRMEHFRITELYLHDFMGSAYLPNSAELLGIYSRMVINTFYILDSNLNSIGSGLYLGCSVIDHSCAPNAVATFDGINISIRALDSATCLDVDKTFISYTNLLCLPKERQKELEQAYYFTCGCSRCKNSKEIEDMLSMACPRANCPGSIYISESHTNDVKLFCPVCEVVINQSHVDKYLEAIEFTNEKLEMMKTTTYLDICKVCLEKQNGVLHSLNMYHVKILDLAFESCIMMSQWKFGVDCGKKLMPAYRKYLGDDHPQFGIALVKLFKMMLMLEPMSVEDCELAREYIHEGAKIIKLTFGEQHDLFKKEVIPLLSN